MHETLLETEPAAGPQAQSGTAVLYRLVRGVALAVAEVPASGAPRRLEPFDGGARVAGSTACAAFATSSGTTRFLVAFHWPADRRPDSLQLRPPHGSAPGDLVACAVAQRYPIAIDAAELLRSLDAGERVRAIRFLLELPRSTFPGINGRGYASLCLDVLRKTCRIAAPLSALAAATNTHALWTGSLPVALDGPVTGVVVTREGVAPQSHLPLLLPDRRGAATLYLMAATGGDGAVLALFGASGMAAVPLAWRNTPPPSLLAWLDRNRKVDPLVRDFIAASLAALAPGNPMVAAVLTELTLFRPGPRRLITAPDRPIGAAIECAIGCGNGLFVSGWVRDPYNIVEQLVEIGAAGTSRPVDIRSIRFGRPDVESRYVKSPYGAGSGSVGFATYLLGRAVLGGQPRFELRLKSGAGLPLVAPPASPDPAAARNAVLAAVPANSASCEAVIRSIGPAAAALHRQHLASRRAPELVMFGNPPRRPRASIVVPLYRNLDFLRFQLAAFAVDRSLRDVELIYVLDSPEQREAVEHLLEGLHGLYGLPLKLVIMSGNFGYAAANNAGVAHAEGRLLLLLNSDVVPASPGWFDAMAAAFEAPTGRKIGAVGPKLLFDDGSLQHAGLFFRRDRRGRWLNDHYFKGMPRDFPAACRPGSVPAVTGAAVMVPGALFRAVGGFTEDYIIGDYEDSDLCLKLRRAGRDIVYVPAAELHHFERKSIERHAGYMRGVASEYNGWLHHERWDATIAALMEEFAPAIRAERRRVPA